MYSVLKKAYIMLDSTNVYPLSRQYPSSSCKDTFVIRERPLMHRWCSLLRETCSGQSVKRSWSMLEWPETKYVLLINAHLKLSLAPHPHPSLSLSLVLPPLFFSCSPLSLTLALCTCILLCICCTCISLS